MSMYSSFVPCMHARELIKLIGTYVVSGALALLFYPAVGGHSKKCTVRVQQQQPRIDRQSVSQSVQQAGGGSWLARSTRRRPC